MKNGCGATDGIHGHDKVLLKGLEHGRALLFVNAPAPPDDFIGCIIKTVFLERTSAQAIDHDGFIGADKVKNSLYIHVMIKKVCLLDIARDAIEDKDIACRAVAVCADHCIHSDAPEFYGGVIGHEEALAGIVHKDLAKLRGHVEVAKDISTSEVDKAGDGPEGFSKCAFAVQDFIRLFDGIRTIDIVNFYSVCTT